MKNKSIFFLLIMFISFSSANLEVGIKDDSISNVIGIDLNVEKPINYSLIPTVNSSDYWDDLDTINTTQMEDNGGTLNILESWLTSFFDNLFSGKTTDDLTEGSTNLYSQWITTGSDIYYSNGDVGIGTSSPLGQLHINGSSNPAIYLTEGANDSYFRIQEDQSTQVTLNQYSASSNALIDFNPMPLDGSSNANFRFFRNTDTSGTVKISIFEGNNSDSIAHLLDAKGTSVINYNGDDQDFIVRSDDDDNMFYINAGSNTMGLGVGNSPLGKLHINTSSTYPLYLGDITDSVNKFNFIVSSQYDTDETEGALMTGSGMTSGVSFLYIGGGISSRNAMTELKFYTGSTPTTRTGTEWMTIKNGGKIGFHTSSPVEAFHFSTDFSNTIMVGVGDDVTNKVGYITSTQYNSTNEAEGFLLFGTFAPKGNNNIFFGGGSSGRNAATDIKFYTAPNETMRTGIERMNINSDGLVTANYGLNVIGDLNVTGNIKLGEIPHAYGGFQNVSQVIPVTQNDWSNITNSTGNLWTGYQIEQMDFINDTLIINTAGDYFGSVSLTLSGANGDDYLVRIYNVNTSTATPYIGVTTTGATNYQNINLPIYLEDEAGQYFRLQITNTKNDNDPTIRSAIFNIKYLHT